MKKAILSMFSQQIGNPRLIRALVHISAREIHIQH